MQEQRYHSPLRAEQAAETRRRILDAARDLDAEVGFTAATVSEIARRAGVAPATVYGNFESKPGLVAAMIGELEKAAGMEWRMPLMLEETDPRRSLEHFVAANRAVFESGHVLLRAAYDAMGLPEVRALAQAGDANRRRGAGVLVGRWENAGGLRPGLDPEHAAETLWLLSSVEQYLLATEVLGWSGDAYEAWLTATLSRLLLDDPE